MINVLKKIAAVAVVLSLLLVCGCSDEESSEKPRKTRNRTTVSTRAQKQANNKKPIDRKSDSRDSDNNTVDEYVIVPNYLGDYVEYLTSADYELFSDVETVYEFSDDYEKGQIIEQEPAAGSSVIKGKRVLKLTVSSGLKEVELPSINEGDDLERVKSLLTKWELVPTVVEVSSDTVEKGKVVKIECVDEKPVKGSIVYVYVSTGKEETKPKTVSDVVGSTKEDAIKKLRGEGFKVIEANIIEENSEKPAGTVLEQSPDAGSSLIPGSEITLTVSSGYRDV